MDQGEDEDEDEDAKEKEKEKDKPLYTVFCDGVLLWDRHLSNEPRRLRRAMTI